MTPWTLTRKDNNTTLELPADMRWRDEFDWQALAQSQVQYSLGGSAIIQQGHDARRASGDARGRVDMA